jgi:hypothetical protein
MTVGELMSALEQFDAARTVELAVGGDGAIHCGAAVRVVRLHESLVLITSEES